MITDFHFLRPEWFLLIPFMVFLFWMYYRRKAVSRSWQAVCDPELLLHLLVGHSKGKKGKKILAILTLGGTLSLFALAGPVWQELAQPVFRDQSALVVVLDLSLSMDATDIRPSRLTRARHKLIDILKNRKEGYSALVVYAAEAFVVSPLTQDADTIISQVTALKTDLMPIQGSRPDMALKKAKALFEQAGVLRGRVLLITDGVEHISKTKLEQSVIDLKNAGHSLSILGVGTTTGGPIQLAEGGFLKDKVGGIVIPKLDERSLSRVAQEGGGTYQRMSVDDRDVRLLLSETTRDRFQDRSEKTAFKTDRWREEGPWLLIPLLPIVAFAFRRGLLVFTLVISLGATNLVYALDWDALWSRKDQRAAEAFEQGELAAAAELFEDPQWKSAAYYRAGEYEKSFNRLEGIDSADAFYNKGNGLAKSGHIPEAIQAYDEALKRDPNHEDALYNKEQLQQMSEGENRNPEEGEPTEGEDGEASDKAGAHPEQSNSQAGKPGEASSDSDLNPRDEDQNREEANLDSDREEDPTENQAEDETRDRVAKADDLQDDESRQAMEQWLRRIPDDPGGLLRRKFLFQSKRRKGAKDERLTW